MKFGKEFAAQMVPEWQQAYMDYNFLKTHLKNIHHYRQRSTHAQTQCRLKRKLTLYRAFSGLTQKETHRCPSFASETDIENQAILVSKNGAESYRTTFLKAAEEGGENELDYFRMLDDEFNKVNDFYKSKVDEVMEEAGMLNKQMDALIAFRVKVENPEGLFHESERVIEMGLFSSDFAASSSGSSSLAPAPIRSNGTVQIAAVDAIGEGWSESRESDQEQSIHGNDETKAEICENSKSEEEKPKKTIMAVTLPPLKVLGDVKINNTLETPRSTIKGFLNYPWNSELKFNRENLVKAEEKLKQAFVVFYQKLLMLKSFSFLNMLAFSKIMKKYDKITLRNAAKSYMKMVDASYLGSSDEVTKLIERVEKTFIKHFCNSSRRKGMNILRPKAKKERHLTTFSMGFFGGCTVALIAALVLIIHARNILDAEGGTTYMETLFPLYSLFGFVVLHMLVYAGNIYFWRRYRVNYSFIFGFKQGTELSYREVLLLSFGLAVLALGCVLSNLDMEMDAKTKDYKAFTELLPLTLVLLVMVTLLLPFNIIYRSSRFFFIATLFHCFAAPLYKVTLPDFFLADQLTSQVQAFRSLEFYICYYGWGDYKQRKNTCRSSDVFNTFYFLVAVIPYWSRLLQLTNKFALVTSYQCLRRLCEEKDPRQGFNGLKYFFAIAAVSLRTAYRLYRGLSWKRLAWIFSIIAALFGTYWDLVMDWGLLQLKSKNFLLRDKLLVPYKSVYFAAMVLNVLLRLAWMQTVLDFQLPFLHRQGLITVVACLEIIRRGIWNFFRLENEHLNNVGKYRAFKSIPLPFNYEDDDDEKED